MRERHGASSRGSATAGAARGGGRRDATDSLACSLAASAALFARKDVRHLDGHLAQHHPTMSSRTGTVFRSCAARAGCPSEARRPPSSRSATHTRRAHTRTEGHAHARSRSKACRKKGLCVGEGEAEAEGEGRGVGASPGPSPGAEAAAAARAPARCGPSATSCRARRTTRPTCYPPPCGPGRAPPSHAASRRSAGTSRRSRLLPTVMPLALQWRGAVSRYLVVISHCPSSAVVALLKTCTWITADGSLSGKNRSDVASSNVKTVSDDVAAADAGLTRWRWRRRSSSRVLDSRPMAVAPAPSVGAPSPVESCIDRMRTTTRGRSFGCAARARSGRARAARLAVRGCGEGGVRRLRRWHALAGGEERTRPYELARL